jgi:hypothetical protein
MDASDESRHTMREDYEIGVDSSGLFEVNYSCVCTECGFDYAYRYVDTAAKGGA